MVVSIRQYNRFASHEIDRDTGERAMQRCPMSYNQSKTVSNRPRKPERNGDTTVQC